MHDKPARFPAYPRKPHKASGQARIRYLGRDYYLGPFDSERSRKEYARLAQEFATAPGSPLAAKATACRISIDELVALWLTDSRSNAMDEREIEGILIACSPLCRMLGSTFADEFTVPKFEAVRNAMLNGSWMNDADRAARRAVDRAGWSRSYASHQVKRIRRVFRWAEAHGFAPRGTWEHLRTLAPIPRNAKVRTTAKRKPVDFESQVRPCLRFMTPVVAAMVQVQYYAGMRPGEVVVMRRHEVDMASVEGVWLYRPTHHKTERHGELVKAIGPRGQAALAPWLMAAEPFDFVFPPSKQRYKRGHYAVEGYARAVERACARAGVAKWCLYDLRRAAANRAEDAGNISDASALLGHKNIETTKVYLSKQNLEKATEIAKKIG